MLLMYCFYCTDPVRAAGPVVLDGRCAGPQRLEAESRGPTTPPAGHHGDDVPAPARGPCLPKSR